MRKLFGKGYYLKYDAEIRKGVKRVFISREDINKINEMFKEKETSGICLYLEEV
jgi:hypothetical protein